MEELAKGHHGELWEVAPLLRRLAEEERTLN
jgi:hypothetical protein